MNTQPIVDVDNVSKLFGVNDHRTAAVRNITMEARLGELLILMGPSGSGKTTLLTLVAGFLSPSSGRVSLFGRDLTECSPKELQQLRARQMGFVFQTFHLIDSLNALENISLVCRFAGMGRAQAKQQAAEVLKQIHIEHLSGKYPPKLSQGEKQRVALARAIVNRPDLIIADEPTASLETKQGLNVINLLREYAAEQNKCVLVASHDPRITACADRVIWLEDGAISGKGTTR